MAKHLFFIVMLLLCLSITAQQSVAPMHYLAKPVGGVSMDSGNASVYDQYMGTPPTSMLTFYAGRNTSASASPDSELVITTSEGNEYQIFAYDTTTPLVLDMDGDGKLVASKGKWLPHNFSGKGPLVSFDMNGDGFDEIVEWVGPRDGLLLVYTPGQRVTGKNLFGFALGFTDGFEQLSVRDKNQDKKITGQELNNLSVWQDKNSNAKVDNGEIKTVQELGITQISVAHSNLMSTFKQNGKNRLIWDWHPVMFMVKKKK